MNATPCNHWADIQGAAVHMTTTWPSCPYCRAETAESALSALTEENKELKKQLGHTTEPSEAMCGPPPTEEMLGVGAMALLENGIDGASDFLKVIAADVWQEMHSARLAARTPETSPAVESTLNGRDSVIEGKDER